MAPRAYGRIEKIRALLQWMRGVRTIDQLDSPLLFEFHKEVVQRKIDNADIKEIEQVRSRLLQDDRLLSPKDYGAGSYLTHKTTSRSVKSIASSAVSDKRKCTLLYNICRHVHPQNILELGTSLGISAMYLQAASPLSQVTTVEGDPGLSQIFEEHLLDSTKAIRLINTSFLNAIDQLAGESAHFDLLYLDGGHQSDLLFSHLKALEKVMSPQSLLIIDDIYWSADMTKAWTSLKERKTYNVAIDMWYFGLLWHDTRVKEDIDVRIAPINRRWQVGLFR